MDDESVKSSVMLADQQEQDAEDAERQRVEGPPMGNGMESVMPGPLIVGGSDSVMQ